MNRGPVSWALPLLMEWLGHTEMLSKEDVWELQGHGRERGADEGHEEFTPGPIPLNVGETQPVAA